MSSTVWMLARTLDYPDAGGHMWVYLNWALGLRALGCDVVWLELADDAAPPERLRFLKTVLKGRLEPYGLGDRIALCSRSGAPLEPDLTLECVPYETAGHADLLLDVAYGPPGVVERFRRSALLDIDPGLCQIWISGGDFPLPRHDVYFTIGETVGRPEARFPDCGVTWEYTPPCIALDWWHPSRAPADAPFTTVSTWKRPDYWIGDDQDGYANDKRSGFLAFLDLPRLTPHPLELALSLDGTEGDERAELERLGWRVVDAQHQVASPGDYQRYIARSRGEFSCAKPSCIRLQNAWISDRTLCYLASGKPAVVQHTGPSRFLPDDAGLFRFTTIEQAARHLETVAADYERQAAEARALVEEHFDARCVAKRLLERALN